MIDYLTTIDKINIGSHNIQTVHTICQYIMYIQNKYRSHMAKTVIDIYIDL